MKEPMKITPRLPKVYSMDSRIFSMSAPSTPLTPNIKKEEVINNHESTQKEDLTKMSLQPPQTSNVESVNTHFTSSVHNSLNTFVFQGKAVSRNSFKHCSKHGRKAKKPVSFFINFDGNSHIKSLSVKKQHSRSKSVGEKPVSVPKSVIHKMEKRSSLIKMNKASRAIINSFSDMSLNTKAGSIQGGTNGSHKRHPTYPAGEEKKEDLKIVQLQAKETRAKMKKKEIIDNDQQKRQFRQKYINEMRALKEHKEKLDILKLKVKNDINQSSAYMKRQKIIQEQIGRASMANQRAQGIGMLARLQKKFGIGMRRSLSSSFAEMTFFDEDEEFEQIEEFRENENSIGDKMSLKITTKNMTFSSDYQSTSSTQSPTATSPAALQIKDNLDQSHPSYPSVRANASLSLSNAQIEESDTLKSPVKAHNEFLVNFKKFGLKRSTSEPSIPSLKNLITHMHLGIPTGLPYKIKDFLPSITRYTLRELDFDEIASNIQTRHDLLFDEDLQFKPNDAESKVTQRTIKNNTFWAKVDHDLKLVLNHRRGSITGENGVHKTTRTIEDYVVRPHFLSFPILINEIGEIMLESLPYSSQLHRQLNEHIDVDLISQQVEHDAFDIVPLISFICKTLKVHCSPMRDTAVDNLEELAKRGDIVGTLKSCFEVLELMKLDQANHYLRKIRPEVVANAVRFEWKYFHDKLEEGHKTIQLTEKWLKESISTTDPFGLTKQIEQNPPQTMKKSSSNPMLHNPIQRVQSQSQISRSASVPLLQNINNGTINTTTPASTPPIGSRTSYTEVFYKAFLSLVVSPKLASLIDVPETFYLDHSRLINFHNEWQDLTILGVLMVLFRQAVGRKVGPEIMGEVKKELWVLLLDGETTIAHVSVHIISKAEKTRGKEFDENERKMLTGLIDKNLAPDSSLFSLIQNRIALHLYCYMKDEALDESLLTKHGMYETVNELKELGKNMRIVVEHNRITYGPIYNEIFKRLLGE